MTVAELNALYEAAVAALDAGNYTAAISAALKAKMRLATMPDAARGGVSMSWNNAVAIDSWIQQVRQLQVVDIQENAAVSGGPFQQIKVNYTRPDAT